MPSWVQSTVFFFFRKFLNLQKLGTYLESAWKMHQNEYKHANVCSKILNICGWQNMYFFHCSIYIVMVRSIKVYESNLPKYSPSLDPWLMVMSLGGSSWRSWVFHGYAHTPAAPFRHLSSEGLNSAAAPLDLDCPCPGPCWDDLGLAWTSDQQYTMPDSENRKAFNQLSIMGYRCKNVHTRHNLNLAEI